MPLSPSAYAGYRYSCKLQHWSCSVYNIYITKQFAFALFSIPVILLPINISNSMKIMLILDCQLFSSLVTALVSLFNLTKSFTFHTCFISFPKSWKNDSTQRSLLSWLQALRSIQLTAFLSKNKCECWCSYFKNHDGEALETTTSSIWKISLYSKHC